MNAAGAFLRRAGRGPFRRAAGMGRSSRAIRPGVAALQPRTDEPVGRLCGFVGHGNIGEPDLAQR